MRGGWLPLKPGPPIDLDEESIALSLADRPATQRLPPFPAAANRQRRTCREQTGRLPHFPGYILFAKSYRVPLESFADPDGESFASRVASTQASPSLQQPLRRRNPGL